MIVSEGRCVGNVDCGSSDVFCCCCLLFVVSLCLFSPVFFGVRRFVSKFDEKSLCDDTDNDNDDDEVDVEIKEEEPTECRSNTKTQFANFSGERLSDCLLQ